LRIAFTKAASVEAISLEDFLEGFPPITREQAVAVVIKAGEIVEVFHKKRQ
jgi:hypothetical protein